MNRQIRLTGIGIMLLFVALFVQLNYVQVVHASALDHNPLNGNRVVQQYTLPRGDIVSADGVTLAQSVPSHDQFKYLREYPTGSLFGQVTGYYSFTYGTDGAEKYYNSILDGSKSIVKVPHSFSQLRNLLVHSQRQQSVTLTLTDRMQALARKELAGRTGSVVALNPKTGAIIAMYSNPTYNPNSLSQHNQQKVQAAWKKLTSTPGGPLLPGAYANRWFPGSTFKIVTASAVYDHKPSLASKSFPVLTALKLPQTTHLLHNYAGSSCGGKILELFTVSCDSGFGAIGLDLGATNLYDEARSFGFDRTPPLDLPSPAQSSFPTASSLARNLPGVAFSAIGQLSVQATPLEMAMVAGAIADKGNIMVPHVLEKVTNAQGQVVSTYKPKVWLHATSASTAAKVTKLMESVVASPNGTGVAARIPGVSVAAKTGTAQTGTSKIDTWFAAFAPANNPTIAVAAVVPNQPFGVQFQGGTIAAPIVKAMIQAYLSGTSTASSRSSGS